MAESSPESRRRESRRRSQNGLPPSLSSSDSLRRLRCSICVKVFTDPVSTSCGHIFCKSCLNKCWENKQTISCPFCGNTLTQRPDPEINTTENTEVVCDVCEDRKLKALKSCLVCQSSYCQTHLEPHSRVAGLMKHKLMDPVRNLEDYICQKHDRPLELFCKDDEKCVCPFCLEGDHKEHITVRIEEEIDERKIDVQQKIQEKTKKIEEIKKTAEDRKRNSEKKKEDHVEIFTDLIRSIESCQTKLLEMMEEQQKAAEKQEEKLIEELEKEITELQMRETELEQLSHTEDHLHLLQIYSSLCSSTESRSLPDINAKTHENLENRRKTLIQLKGNIEEKLEQTLSEELKWVQKHAVDVTLDPDTAHVGLILSKDEKQTELMKTQKDVQQMIQDRIKKIQQVKHSAGVRKTNSENKKAAHVEIFTDLICSVERCQTELLEMMEEQQKAAEKQEEELIEELEQEITELKMRNTELEQLSHTEDHLHLLQSYSSLQSSPADTRNWPEISLKTRENLETLRRALNKLKDTVEEKLSQTVSAELKWMQQYAVDVTLDPDTAHPYLILSDDGKQVTCGDIRQKLPDKSQRFDPCPCVLGKEGFSSGRFYFEVQVKGKTDWILGMARESVDRKGEITLTPSNGFWTVILRNCNEYKACADYLFYLSLKVNLQRVGVFVDYEEGLVSFYDVESSSHIYSFTGQTFTDKLYPCFSPGPNYAGKNSNPLIITPLRYNK